MKLQPKHLLALASLGLTAWLAYAFLLPELRPKPGQPEIEEPASQGGSRSTGVPADLRRTVEGAKLLEAGPLLRRALLQHADRPEAEAVRKWAAARGRKAVAEARSSVEDLRNARRFRDAAETIQRWRRAWSQTPASGDLTKLLWEVREEESAGILRLRDEVRELIAEGKLKAARETLESGAQFEDLYAAQVRELRRSVDGLLARAGRQPTKPRTEPRPVVRIPGDGPQTPKPSKGGGGKKAHDNDPKVKREQTARALLDSAVHLFTQKRYGPSLQALEELESRFGDVWFIRDRRDGLAAMRTLILYDQKGVTALFNAARVTKKGKKVRLRYTFGPEQLQDWELIYTIRHPKHGEFERTVGGVRGSDTCHFVHRAYFQNDVKMRCRALPARKKTFGVAFCQMDNETREVMLLVANHWVVEGENYRKERPGHAILFVGKGVNADVPVDSPDTGFIFIGNSIQSPQVEARHECHLSLEMKKLQVTGTVKVGKDEGEIRRQAKGDDGRGIEKLRPALFVIENSVVFRELIVEGRLHPDFEKTRVQELWDLIETLE